METHFDNIAESHSMIARQRIMADLKQLARDSEDLLKATAHDTSEQAREARIRVTSALARAKSTFAELQEQVVTTAKDAARKTDLVIRQHPYESLGVAFGVGLLIGVLTMRIGRKGRD